MIRYESTCKVISLNSNNLSHLIPGIVTHNTNTIMDKKQVNKWQLDLMRWHGVIVGMVWVNRLNTPLQADLFRSLKAPNLCRSGSCCLTESCLVKISANCEWEGTWCVIKDPETFCPLSSDRPLQCAWPFHASPNLLLRGLINVGP